MVLKGRTRQILIEIRIVIVPESSVVMGPKYLGKYIAVNGEFNVIGYADSREELERELTRRGSARQTTT